MCAKEIQGALARQIPIVPVLVGGASMSQLTGLQDSLAGLSQYEAAERHFRISGEQNRERPFVRSVQLVP